jgi:DNA-binding beta-propeller fold protein YncE
MRDGLLDGILACLVTRSMHGDAATIHGLCTPVGVAVSPGGPHIYVTNYMARGTVAVIDRQ